MEENLKTSIYEYCKINSELYEESELLEDIEFLRNYMKIRELKSIFQHELIIEKELLLFFDEEIPVYQPTFMLSSWDDIKEKFNSKNDIKRMEAFYDINCEIKKINVAIDGEDLKNINNNSNNEQSLSLSLSEELCKEKNKYLNINESGSSINNNEERKKTSIDIINQNQSNNNIILSNNDISSNSQTEINENKSESEKNESKSEKNENESKSDKKENQSKRQKKNNQSKSKKNRKSKSETNDYKNFLDKCTKIENNDICDEIESIKFIPYIPDNDTIDTLFEADVTNFIYDILYILNKGKLIFFRNKEYFDDNNQKFEFDFQIRNMPIKNFLYLLYLLYPNISTLETLKFDINSFFTNLDNTIEKIDKLNLEEFKELKDYEYLDIIGEVTIDILNQKIRKNEQIKKFGSLMEKLDNSEELNKKFNFNINNKKIVLVFTDGKYDDFYYNFKINKKNNKIFENSKKYNFLYIYIRNKFDKIKIYEEKLKYKYIELLEKKIKNNINELKLYKNINFSEIYNGFYKKVIISQKLDSIRDTLAKIKRNYIFKLPNLFFKELNNKLSKEDIIKIFNPILNIKVDKEQFDKINNKFENTKNFYKPYISVFEFGPSEKKLFEKRFQNDKFFVIKHQALIYKLDEKLNENKLKDCLEIFIDSNSTNKTIQKIIIIDTKNSQDPCAFCLINLLFNIDKDERKIIHLLCPKIFEALENFIKNFISNTTFYNDNNDLNKTIEKIVDSYKRNQFIYWTLIKEFSFIDKQLKNTIITDSNTNTFNNYIEKVIIKIKQEISLYYTNEYNKKLFDENQLKQNIINYDKYYQAFVDGIINDISNYLIKKIKKIKPEDNNEFNLYSVIINCFQGKFKNYKCVLRDIYYNYIYKVYDGLIKIKIQKNILNDYFGEY